MKDNKRSKSTLGAVLITLISFIAMIGSLAAFLFRLIFVRRDKDTKAVIKRGRKASEDAREDTDGIRRAELLDETKVWVEAHHPDRIHVRSYDGLKLTARLIRAEENQKKAAILVHGFRSEPEWDFGGLVQFYHKEGYHVLLVDDRAHGESEGNILGFGWLDRRDVVSWARQLVLLFGEDVQLILHGVSMGAAAVMMASGEYDLPTQVRGIIEDCGFSSTLDEFRHIFPKYLKALEGAVLAADNMIVKITSGYDLKDASCKEQLKLNFRPALFIHGSEDKFVPVDMVYDNYYATKGEKTLYVCKGADHARSYAHDPETYEKTVLSFLDSL